MENLRYFRKKDVPQEAVEAEVEFVARIGNEGKGGWNEVFNKANRVYGHIRMTL